MPPKSWGFGHGPPLALRKSLLTPATILLLIVANSSSGMDVFCGQLTIHKQKWFAKDTQTLGARMATDLRDCLNTCCGIPACNAVTFMGFLGHSPTATANCVMFQCAGDCQTVDEPIATDGVVSVTIRREVPTTAQQLESRDDVMADSINGSVSSNHTVDLTVPTDAPSSDENTDGESGTTLEMSTSAPTVVFSDDKSGEDGAAGIAPTEHTRILITPGQRPSDTPLRNLITTPPTQTPVTSTTAAADDLLGAGFFPVWAAGIAIVILVCCVGLNLTLVSVYLCVKRNRSKMRHANITSLKAPTLHAFNPTSLHTTASTMA